MDDLPSWICLTSVAYAMETMVFPVLLLSSTLQSVIRVCALRVFQRLSCSLRMKAVLYMKGQLPIFSDFFSLFSVLSMMAFMWFSDTTQVSCTYFPALESALLRLSGGLRLVGNSGLCCSVSCAERSFI